MRKTVLGEAGVFFVCGELARRDASVWPCPPGWQSKDLDVQKVINGHLESYEIQVKTTRRPDLKGFQGVRTDWVGDHRLYVFVGFYPDGRIRYLLVPSAEVVEQAKADLAWRHRDDRRHPDRPVKEFSECWGYDQHCQRLMHDTTIEERAVKAWEEFLR